MKSKKLILVIEDDPYLLKSITKALHLRNYNVVEARNGAEGLDALKQNPDLIWLDLYMPKLDGLEFLDKLRTMPSHRDTPVFVVTVSRGKDEIAEHLPGVNVKGHFIKSDVTLAKIVNGIDLLFVPNS